MAADELDTRKKHRSSPDDGTEAAGLKRHKHRHHRRRHRHRNSKHDNDSKYEKDDTVPAIAPSPNSRFDDEKEEGEILEEKEEDRGVCHEELLKKKMDSDVESGEINPDEVVDRSNNRDPGILGVKGYPGKFGEELEPNLNLLPHDGIEKNAAPSSKKLKVFRGDAAASDLEVDVRNKYDHHLSVQSDGEDVEMKRVEFSYLKEHEVRVTDGLNAGPKIIRSREKKREIQGDMSPRHGGVSCENGDVGYKSHKEDKSQHRESGSPITGFGKDKYNRESDENDSRRYARSRSPAAREDVHLRRNRKIDDSGGINRNRETELHNSMRYEARVPSELMDVEKNGSGDQNKSVSPEITRSKYKTESCSLYHNKYHDKAHRNSSRPRDSTRDRRSRSQSVLMDGVHHEMCGKSHKDDGDLIEPFDSREKETDNSNRERVRYSREDRHGSRDLVRSGKRELSYSRYSGREAGHGSRETRNRDRDRGRGRESDKDRDRDRNRDREKERRGRERGRRIGTETGKGIGRKIGTGIGRGRGGEVGRLRVMRWADSINTMVIMMHMVVEIGLKILGILNMN